MARLAVFFNLGLIMENQILPEIVTVNRCRHDIKFEDNGQRIRKPLRLMRLSNGQYTRVCLFKSKNIMCVERALFEYSEKLLFEIYNILEKNIFIRG